MRHIALEQGAHHAFLVTDLSVICPLKRFLPKILKMAYTLITSYALVNVLSKLTLICQLPYLFTCQ